MNIVIAGAGAMGCRFGAALFQAGYEVVLVDSWKEHVHSITQNGLILETEKGVNKVNIQAVTPENLSMNADILAVFTKSVDTENMIEKCRPIIHEKTKVLTLQNGIGNLEILAQYASKEQLFAGTTTYAANLKGPGLVAAFGSGNTEIMQIDGKRETCAKQMISMFNRAGINAAMSKDIIKSIWEKAAFNSILNPICTLTLSPVAQVGSYSHISEIIEGVLNEIDLVAGAERVNFDKKKVKRTIYGVFNPSMSGHHYSSMYHDIKKARKTEIDFLNGAIVERAKKHNIEVPYTSLLHHLIKMLEDSVTQENIHQG